MAAMILAFLFVIAVGLHDQAGNAESAVQGSPTEATAHR